MREQQSQFEAILDNLEPIGNFIAAFMREAKLPDEQIYNFAVSSDEHVSNLIEHAFNERSDRMITVICRDEVSKAQVIVVDRSKGFDPRHYSIPDVEGSAIYELPPGGFGNYFICELMDDVEYIHEPYVKNELILTMYKKPITSSSND
jgi:anti-sigma regulatory factor (Ser/Thr protein kinase)